MYAPPCTILDQPLLPCRDLCESAKEGCENLLKSFDYTWPKAFSCSKFPEKSTHENLRMSKLSSSDPLPNDFNQYGTSTVIPSKFFKAWMPKKK